MTIFSVKSVVKFHRGRASGFGILAFTIVCLFLFSVVPSGHVLAAGNSLAQNAAARPDDSAGVQGQSALQARRHAERYEEIRQKKIDNPEVGDSANVYRHSPAVHTLARLLGLSVEVTSRLFETINFIILLIGIVWLIARILPKALRNRSERIQNQLQQARVATEEANRRLADIEARLSSLDSEIGDIKTRAEQETANEEKRLRAAMEQEKRNILDAASLDIAAASRNAQNLLKNLAADLVIEHAKRQISVTQETDRSLVDSFLTDLDGKRDGQPRGGVN